MLRTTNELKGYAIAAVDGAIGHVADLLVDDVRWVVRYVAVRTGGWLARDRVLISPTAIGVPDLHTKTLPVSITREQVRESPDIDTHRPVSRHHEIEYARYYAVPGYWDAADLWAGGHYADPGLRGEERHAFGLLDYGGMGPPLRDRRDDDDPHLRSADELCGYALHARDGDIGHVCNLLVEDRTWAVRHLGVELGHWWHGRSVPIPPRWVRLIDWGSHEIRIGRTRDDVRRIPEYDPGKRFDAEVERRYVDHFGRHR